MARQPVVSNTSPPITLAGVGLLELLPAFYGEIWMAEADALLKDHEPHSQPGRADALLKDHNAVPGRQPDRRRSWVLPG